MIREYQYRPRWKTFSALAFAFATGAVLCVVIANDNKNGLIIGNAIRLSPEGATVFYWAAAATSLVFFGATVFIAIRCAFLHQRIIVSDKGIVVPRTRWSSEETAITYNDILDVNTSEVSGQRFLTIIHGNGKFELASTMLPSEADFDEICAVVNLGVNATLCVKDL